MASGFCAVLGGREKSERCPVPARGPPMNPYRSISEFILSFSFNYKNVEWLQMRTITFVSQFVQSQFNHFAWPHASHTLCTTYLLEHGVEAMVYQSATFGKKLLGLGVDFFSVDFVFFTYSVIS